MRVALRTDTVGSLLRPERLHEARTRFASGALDAAELREVEDEAISEAVRLQDDIGLTVVTDGEFRRENWWIDFVSKLQGIAIKEGHGAAFKRAADLKANEDTGPGDRHEHGHHYVPKTVLTTSRVGATAPIMLDDYRFLASLPLRRVVEVAHDVWGTPTGVS